MNYEVATYVLATLLLLAVILIAFLGRALHKAQGYNDRLAVMALTAIDERDEARAELKSRK